MVYAHSLPTFTTSFLGRLHSLLLILALLVGTLPAHAEGSKDLYPESYQTTYGLDNADVDWRFRAMLVSATSAVNRPYPTQGTFYVFAKAGEHIYLASSALGCQISLRSPKDGESKVYTVAAEQGYIKDRDAELAGPKYSGASNANAYAAFKFDVDYTGIWEVEFHAKESTQTAVPAGKINSVYDFGSPHSTLVYPTLTSENESGNLIDYSTNDWHTNEWVENEEENKPGSGSTYDMRDGTSVSGDGYYHGTNVSNVFVSAFDATVTDAADTEVKSGRLYANILNLAIWGPKESTSRWYGKFYILNHNGSVATFMPNGMCGDNISLFANNKGITTNGDASYKSATSLANAHDPRTTDVTSQQTDANGNKVTLYEDVTYKIFFNEPASDLPTTPVKCAYGYYSVHDTWLRKENPSLEITNLDLVGKGSGTSGGFSSNGSNITFTAPMQGVYSIELDFENNRYRDRTLTGYFFEGDNVVEWDGKDANGKQFTISTRTNNNKVTLTGTFNFSEFHFPLYDVARNVDGFNISIDSPGTATSTLYWDDTDIATTTDSEEELSVGKASTSVAVSDGGDSAIKDDDGAASPAHAWGNTFKYTYYDPDNIWDFWGTEYDNLTNDRGENAAIDTWLYQSTTASETVTLATEKVNLSLTSAEGGAACVGIGDEVSYSLTVQNVKNTNTNVNTTADAKGATIGLIMYDADGNRLDNAFSISSITTTAATTDAYVISQDDATIFIKNGVSATFTITGSFSSSTAHKSISAKAFVMHPADLYETDANNTDDPTDPIAEYDGMTNNNFSQVDNVTDIANNEPVANSDSYTTTEDVSPFTANVLDNDEDPDGDQLQVTFFYYDGDQYSAGKTAKTSIGELSIAADGTLTFKPDAYEFYEKTHSVSVSYDISDGFKTATCDDLDEDAGADVDITYGTSFAPEISPTALTIKGRKNPVKLPIIISDSDNDPLTLSISGTDADKFRFDYTATDTTLYYIGGALKADATYHINVSAYDGSVKTTKEVTVNVKKIAEPHFEYTNWNKGGTLWLGVPQWQRGNGTRYDAVRTTLVMDEDVSIPSTASINSNDFAFFDGQLYFVWNSRTAGTKNGNIAYNLVVSFTDSEGLYWEVPLTVHVNCSGTFGEVKTSAKAANGYYGSTLEDLLSYWAYYFPANSKDSTNITYEGGPWMFSENGTSYQLSSVLPAGSHTVRVTFSPETTDAAFADKNNIVNDVTFTIYKRNVILTSQDGTWVYNKEAHQQKVVNASEFVSVTDGNGFLNDEGVECSNFAYIVEVGTRYNDFTYAAKNTTDLNNYNITVNRGTLKVTKREVESKDVTIYVSDLVYNGQPQGAAALRVVVDGKVVPSSAYTTPVFTNNIHAGTATVSFKDSGQNENYKLPDYTGTFKILQREVTLTWDYDELTYNAKPQKVSVTSLGHVVNNDKGNVYVSEYAGRYEETDVGDYTAIAARLNNKDYKFPADSTHEWKIVPLKLSDYTITLNDEPYTYTGAEIKPKVTLTATVDGNEVTIPANEYTVTCSNNIAAASSSENEPPTVTISDVDGGNYVLGTKYLTFTINPATLTAQWDYTVPFTYNDGTTYKVAVTSFTDQQGNTVNIPDAQISYPSTGTTSTTTYLTSASSAGTYTAKVVVNNSNYILDKSETLTWIINKKKITPTVTYTNSFIFNGKEQKPEETSIEVTPPDGIALTLGKDYEVEWAGSDYVTADTKTFTINSLDASNYTFSLDCTYTITPKPVTLTWTGGPSYAYNGKDQSVKATLNAAEIATGYPCKVNPTDNVKKDVGSYTATATLSDTKNYKLSADSKSSYSWEITPKTLTAYLDNTSFDYDGTEKSVTVKFKTLCEGDKCNAVGTGDLTGTAAKEYTYTVTGVDNDNYVLASAPQILSWEIKKAETAVTVKVSPTSANYNGTTQTPTVTVYDANNNVIPSTEYSANWTDSSNKVATLKDAGTYTVTITPGDNYTFTNSATATATFTINPIKVHFKSSGATKIYDGQPLTNNEVKLTEGSFLDGETYTINVAGTQTTVGNSKNEFTVTLTGNAKAQNYKVETEYGDIKVTARELDIKWGTTTFTYTGNPFTVNPTLENVVNGDKCDISVSGTLTATDVDDYSIEVSIIGNDAFNYKLPAITAITWHIVPPTDAPIITLDEGYDYTYDGTSKTPAVTVTVGKLTLSQGDDFTVDYSSNIDAGKATVTVTNKSKNYSFAPVEATFTITPRPVTLTSESAEKYYNGTPLTNSGVKVTSPLGFVAGQGATYTVTGTRTNVGSSENKFTYTLNEGTDAKNYDITPVPGTLTVNPMNLTIEWGKTEFTYDGTTKSVTPTLSGVANNETCTLTLENDTKTEADEYTVTATGMTCSNSPSNYTITFPQSTSWEIKKAETAVTVVIDSGNQFKYNGQQQKPTFHVEDANGNTINPDQYTATFSDVTTGTPTDDITNVGFKQITVTSNGDNYIFSKVEPDYYSINRRVITLTSGDGTWRYDGKEHKAETVTVGGDKFVGEEGVDITYTGARTEVGSSKNEFTYTLKTNTKEGNYIITTETGTLTVEAAEPVVTITVGDYTYDGSEHKPAVSVKAEINGVEQEIPADEYTVTYADNKDAGEGKATVTVTDKAGGNFDVPETKRTFDIKKRSVTLTSSTLSKDFDNTPLHDDNIKVSGDGFADGESFTYSDFPSITNAGSVSNTFKYAAGANTSLDNYIVTPVYGTLTVNPAPAAGQIVTLEADAFDYTGNDIKPSVTVTIGGVEISDSEYNVSYSNNLNVGTATVTVTNRDNGNYVVETATVNFTINPAILTVNGTTLDCKSYDGDNTVTVHVGTLQGIKGNDEVNVTATAHAASKDAGENIVVNIAYTLGGSAAKNYAISADGTQTVTITPATLTLTSEGDSKVYDGMALKNETVNAEGLISGEGFDYYDFTTISEVGKADNKFSYTAQSGTLASNYTIQEVYGTLEITSKPLAASDLSCAFESIDYTYSGHAIEPKVTITALGVTIPDSEYNVTYEDNINAGENTAIVKITNADGGNYTVADATFTFSIDQREVTLTWAGTDLTYTGVEQGPTLTIGGVQTRLVEGVEVADEVTATVTGDKETNVGDYTAEAVSLDNANYKLPTVTTQDWSITSKVLSPDYTIEQADTTLIYTATAQEMPVTLHNPDGSIIPSSEYIVTYENNTDAGTATITITNAPGGNLVVPDGHATFTINPAPLTVSVSDVEVSKQYDGTADVKCNASVSGTIPGTDAMVTTTVTYDNANAGTDKTITAHYSVATPNYYLTTESEVISTTGEITPITLTVSETSVDNKTFDGTTTATVSNVGILTGVLASDNVTIASATANFSDKNAGNDKLVTVTYTLSGDQAVNYILPDQTLTASITPLSLTVSDVTIDAQKVYDGTTTANVSNVGNLSNVTSAMNVQISSATAQFADKNVGTAKPVTVKFSISGDDAANCVIPDMLLTADITPLNINATGAQAHSKKFDGTTTATLSNYGSLVGVIYGDNVTIDQDNTIANFADAKPGSDKVVNITYALAGSDADNYNVAPLTLNNGIIKALKRDASDYSFSTDTDLTYDGDPKPATITGDGSITIYYSSDNGVTWTTDEPVNAGHYNVKIHVDATDEYEAADLTDDSWNYDITKAEQSAPTLTAQATSKPSADDGKIIGLTTDMEIRYEGQTSYQKVTNPDMLFAAGNYCVRYSETDNYLASSEIQVVINKGDKLNRDLNDYTVTLPEYLGYNGNAKEVTVTGPGDITVYYKAAGGEWTTTQPVDKGVYHVRFTVDEDYDYNPADFTDGAWSFTISREPIQIENFIVTAHGYCPGADGIVKFTIVTGSPIEFRVAIVDTTTAVTSYISEAEYHELDSDTEFTFTVPQATEGKRKLLIQFRESDGLASEVYSVEVNINLSDQYLRDIWYDVVSIVNKIDLNNPDNLTPRFQAYKWYRNDEELVGQTKPYVQQVGGLEGTYYAMVTTTDSLGAETLYTCPKTWEANNKALTLRVYPNPVITIANVELSQNDGNDHSLTVVDNKGIILYRGTFNGATTTFDMSSYEAGSYVIVVDNLKAIVVKK